MLTSALGKAASPAVLLVFALAGATFGAYALGAVAYDRRLHPR